MNIWMTDAKRLALLRAPHLTEEHAWDVADDLFRAWPERSPAEAVGYFVAFMPPGWNGSQQPQQLAA